MFKEGIQAARRAKGQAVAMEEERSREQNGRKKVQRVEHRTAPPRAESKASLGAESVPASSLSSLGDPKLGGRANQPVRVDVMRQAQQTYGNRAVHRFLQRQHGGDTKPAAQGATDAAAQVTAATVREWPTRLPHAARNAKTAITVDSGGGKVNIPDPAVKAPELSKEQQAIVAAIKKNRDGIQENLGLKLEKYGGKKDRGYIYAGTPASDPSPNLANANKRRAEVNKVVWKELAGEGGASAINTYDEQILTWGKGFGGAAGLLPDVVRRFFEKAPDVKDALLDAGFTLADGKWLAVNTETGLVEEGRNALRLIQFDKKVLSLLIKVSEDAGSKQKFIDAQWGAIAANAGNVPDAALKWADTSIALVAHCIHWRPSGWSPYLGTGGDVKEIVKVIGKIIGDVDPKRGNATFVSPTSTYILRKFAGGAAASGMSAAGPLPEDLLPKPKAKDEDKEKDKEKGETKPKDYKGHIFLAAGKGTYYHVEP
jgi:hypothetical protein